MEEATVRERVCSRCKLPKPETEEWFGRDTRHSTGFRRYCRPCEAEKSREWEKQNYERSKARKRRYRLSNPGYCRREHLRQTYGMTVAAFELLLAAQGGVCAICQRHESMNSRRRWWNVDHNHATGFVRGILCNFCNHRLSLLEDDILYAASLEYLERPPAQCVFGSDVPSARAPARA